MSLVRGARPGEPASSSPPCAACLPVSTETLLALSGGRVLLAPTNAAMQAHFSPLGLYQTVGAPQAAIDAFHEVLPKLVSAVVSWSSCSCT